MITKINKLKNFGVFKNFLWNDLDNFKKKNLIYGWNYSGKTTLSKLFQGIKHRDKYWIFPTSEFEITTEKNGLITNFKKDELEDFPYEIKVFNSQYIKDVFISDDMDLDINPISFYLGDTSGKLDKRIKLLYRKREQLENIRDNRYQKVIDYFENYNKPSGKFSAKAKEIRENYLDNKLDQNKLNKATIHQITEQVKGNLSSYILSQFEKEKTKSEAMAENNFEPQRTDYSFKENLAVLSLEVKDILESTAPKSILFPKLEEDKLLFDWVQKGIKLHENKSVCEFCTRILPDNRINDLNSYYSEKLKEIQTSIKDLNLRIEKEREILKIVFPDKKNLGASFQNAYQTEINNYSTSAKIYLAQLTILEDDLKRKTLNYFNNISATEIDVIILKEILVEIEKTLKSNNEWLTEFDKNKKNALDKILKHYVSEYLEQEEYNQKEIDKNSASSIILAINLSINNITKEITELEAKLKSSVKGKEELNSILEILLHRNDIKIVISNDKFTLERGGYQANNLSEGEKSAIAFAYFLTELKALRNEAPPKLPNTIVFIDDPISSLDSNHIFQVRQLIHSFFQEQDFAQLFISTHNFEFFSVMLDTNLFGRISNGTNENKRPLYFIKRSDNYGSTIKKLPYSFSSYKSEYVGLFHTIKEFDDLEHKEDFENLLILPNAVRRFLELYTLMKYPSHAEVDERMKSVFNTEDKPLYNTKLLHWFSHQNQFEKIQQHDDKILQIEDAIKELLEHIKSKDELHWKGLNGD